MINGNIYSNYQDYYSCSFLDSTQSYEEFSVCIYPDDTIDATNYVITIYGGNYIREDA